MQKGDLALWGHILDVAVSEFGIDRHGHPGCLNIVILII